MADTPTTGPADAGATPLHVPAHLKPEQLADVLDGMLADADDARVALSVVVQLLKGCPPTYDICAGNLGRLLTPASELLEQFCIDLNTVINTLH